MNIIQLFYKFGFGIWNFDKRIVFFYLQLKKLSSQIPKLHQAKIQTEITKDGVILKTRLVGLLAKVQARKEGVSNVGERTEQAITLSLPSSMQHVYLLDVVVTEILKEIDFDEDIQEQINLAVIEAGTNAIKHGNKEDLSKKATFQFILAEDKLTIVIEDEGEGFTRQAVADPLDPENLLKSSGRGLFLMEACMDSVTYEANGTIIKMVKYKETPEP